MRDDIPILLGGGGEKKTFGLAARYAQHLNIICTPDELPRKLAALDERCAEVGSDRSTIDTSFLVPSVATDPFTPPAGGPSVVPDPAPAEVSDTDAASGE